MKYEVSKELLQTILDYLSNKPYKEVFILIKEIEKLQPVQDEKKK